MSLFTLIAIGFSLMLFFGSGFIANNILSNPGVKYTLMALAPAIIFVAMSAVLRGYFVGMQNMMEYSKAQVIEQIVNSIFSIIFVVMLLGSTPEIMAAGSTLATTVATSTAFLYLLMYYNKNKKDIWADIKKSEKFAITPKKQIIKKLIDVVTAMDGLQKFGYTIQQANEKFGILLGKVDILNAVPLSINVAFSVALVPFISAAMAKGKKKEAVEKVDTSLKISSVIAFPCAMGLFMLAEPIFLLLFPNASAGAPLLQVQCWTIVFAVLAQTLYGSLQGIGKLYVPGICLVIGAVIKYILNVTLIPIYGEVIPALTTVIYNAIACILSFILLFYFLKERPSIYKLFIKPAFCTAIMAISIFLMGKLNTILGLSNTIYTIMAILVAVIVYFFATILFGVLSENELKQLPFGQKIASFAKKLKKN